MTISSADIVICGAGIAGVAAAYELAVRRGLRGVALVDERPPLSLTSDKSTECYRNWWPGPGDAMVGLMNRSIDLIDDLARATDNLIHLNRRGYLYVTADPARAVELRRAADESAALGAGPARVYHGGPHDPTYLPAHPEGFDSPLDGADVILNPALIRRHFPFLTPAACAVVHARRCGWFSAHLLGSYLLEQARAAGVRLISARLAGVEVEAGRVTAVRLQGEGAPGRLAAGAFIDAAGPFLGEVARLLGVELPVYSERHLKLAFTDQLGVVPREAPLMIWADPQRIAWDADERAWLEQTPESEWMLGEFPAGVHARPEGPAGSPMALMLWDYHSRPAEVIVPPPFDDEFPELVLRGLATMLPGLSAYIGRAPKPIIDGGYYTKTKENRPLIGPLPVQGAYVIGALSGYGLMAAPAAAELLAAHITGGGLPAYAPVFSLERYADPAYQALLENWGGTGQL